MMSRVTQVLAFTLLLFGLVNPVAGQDTAPEDKPASEKTAESQKSKAQRGDYLVEVLNNSPTLSQALAVNKHGSILGVREDVNKEQTIFSQVFFYCAADSDQSTDLPKLKGYTNVEGLALSDNGLVAGFASRPIGTAGGSLTAIVWDSNSGKIVNLSFPEGYAASHAQDINADGTLISGYVSGPEPARMQPCVWSRKAGEETWTAEALPTKHAYNPLILSSRVLISPDGKRVAACCTYDWINNTADSSLFVWERKNDKWSPRVLSDDAFFLRDMNNEGLIVGFLSTKDGLRMPCYMDRGAKLKSIELLAGDESGEAWGVNAKGLIVGYSDDPRGPEGGPQAFIYRDGKTEPINLGDAPYTAAYAINDAGEIAGLLDTAIMQDGVPTERTLAFRTLSP